jgi:hypothetical protein
MRFISALYLATPATLIFAGVVLFLGKWGWRVAWKLPYLGTQLNLGVCPDLNGEWHGTIASNFSQVGGELLRKDLTVTIKADFFGVTMSVQSNDRYSRSEVIASELYRDTRTGAFFLLYLFEGTVDLPEQSDDSTFQGAARLRVRFEGADLHLVGTFWTNRAWHRGENTAGVIELVHS